MKPFSLIIAAAINLSPAISIAQGLVPTIESELEFCQSRPMEPEWIDNLPVRDAYKGLVVQTIYRAQSVQRVVEHGECSCETRFPSWDDAVQHFNDRYLAGDRNELREANTRYLAQFNELRNSARAICEAEGRW